MTNWIVIAPLAILVVPALDRDDAIRQMLDNAGLSGRTWLARDWEVRPATEDESRAYSAFSDAHRRSQKTAATAKNPRKPTAERLGLFDA